MIRQILLLSSIYLVYTTAYAAQQNSLSPDNTQVSQTSPNYQSSTPHDLHWYSWFNLAIGFSQQSVSFIATDEETNTKQGILRGENSYAPTIFLASPYYYFKPQGEGSFGFYAEYGYSSFKADKQEIGFTSGHTVDMGTSVSGKYLYATPVLFYNFGDRHIRKGTDRSFKIGIGVGLGYLQAKGNMVLTETTNETVNIDVDQIGFTTAVLFDYQIGNFLLRARGNGPSIVDEKTRYQLIETTIGIGYVISF